VSVFVQSDPVPSALREALATVNPPTRFGAPLVYLYETGSTNDVAARLAAQGAAEGATVVAAAQTRGRGRRGRTWFSPPGAGLYFSVVFRPALTEAAVPRVHLLTLAAGVAVAEAIEQATGVRADLKWPNDLVVERWRASGASGAPGEWSRRKLAGILAEGSAIGGVLQHVILGIGINILESAYPSDLAEHVTCLAREAGRPVDAFRVLAACLSALDRRWTDLQHNRRDVILDAWRARAPSAMGHRVCIQSAEGPLEGITRGLDDDGALRVEAGGDILHVVAGEVSWL
jgi:BirA family biotin operon repressor/biotin-[acetyl-CoA-carboxylase] ligase